MRAAMVWLLDNDEGRYLIAPAFRVASDAEIAESGRMIRCGGAARILNGAALFTWRQVRIARRVQSRGR